MAVYAIVLYRHGDRIDRPGVHPLLRLVLLFNHGRMRFTERLSALFRGSRRRQVVRNIREVYGRLPRTNSEGEH